MNKDFNDYKNTIKEDIIKYINDFNDSKIIIELKLNLLDLIFDNLVETDNFRNNKIYFDMKLWINLHKKDLFKNNSLLIHNFVNELISKSFISKSSRVYPKNQYIYTVNPINLSFLYTNLKDYQKIIRIRDILIEKLEKPILSNDKEKLNYEINLFIYLKLFVINKIPNNYYEYFKKENVIYIKNKLILVIKEDDEKGFVPLHTIIFDEFTSKILKKVFQEDINLKYNDESIFKKSYGYYSSRLDIFCKSNSVKAKEVKNIIEFEYQLKNSSLHLTLLKDMRHPRISLFELEKLYPNSVNKELLDIEKKNFQIYKNINQDKDNNENLIDEDIEEESDLKTKLKFETEFYEKLKEIAKVPRNKSLNAEYCKKWQNFFKKYNNKIDKTFLDKEKDKIVKMQRHLRDLFNKFDKKEILRDTLYDYFYIIFTFCFDILIKSEHLEQALCDIDTKIKNSDLNPNVQKRYQARVRLFFNTQYNLGYEKIKSVINYNRSIVFLDELDKVVDKLISEDQKKYKNSLYSNSRAVFAILAYYTGLRKGELYSRLIKDFYYIDEDKKFYISVNKKGINLINNINKKKVVSLKNRNAERSFEFEISNSNHFNIVKQYFDEIKKSKNKFLFPDPNNPDSVIKISNVNEINSILQDITNRYTVIHSFRHTYISNEIKKILDHESKGGIFDLIYRVGHNDPEITHKFYAHLDLYYL